MTALHLAAGFASAGVLSALLEAGTGVDAALAADLGVTNSGQGLAHCTAPPVHMPTSGSRSATTITRQKQHLTQDPSARCALCPRVGWRWPTIGGGG